MGHCEPRASRTVSRRAKAREVTDGQAEGLQQASGFACAPLFIESLRADVNVNGAILRNNNRYKAAWFCKVK